MTPLQRQILARMHRLARELLKLERARNMPAEHEMRLRALRETVERDAERLTASLTTAKEIGSRTTDTPRGVVAASASPRASESDHDRIVREYSEDTAGDIP
jgi:hypothetical protein